MNILAKMAVAAHQLKPAPLPPCAFPGDISKALDKELYLYTCHGKWKPVSEYLAIISASGIEAVITKDTCILKRSGR